MDITNKELRTLICECIDENNVCSSMLEIQDIDFRAVRIEQTVNSIDQKLDSIIRFLKRFDEETKQ